MGTAHRSRFRLVELMAIASSIIAHVDSAMPASMKPVERQQVEVDSFRGLVAAASGHAVMCRRQRLLVMVYRAETVVPL